MNENAFMPSRLLSEFAWLEHGFSVGPADVHALARARGCRAFATKQIHGKDVHVLDALDGAGVLEGDAFIASKPGLVCSVRTADCVPILLAEPRQRAVAAVHAGWRGAVCDVVGEAVQRMHEAFGVDPADIRAAVGPRICGACYEVGAEVVEQLGALGIGSAWQVDERHVDLGEAGRLLLERAGVLSEHIDVLPHCTFCDARFVSFRRVRSDARQGSFIVIRG